MIPPINVFPDGWERDDDLNDNFDAVFLTEQPTIVVMYSLQIGDTVAQVKSAFEEWRNRSDGTAFNLADEAFWTERADNARASFRHSNALGQALATRRSGSSNVPDVPRAQKYAREMYEHWLTL